MNAGIASNSDRDEDNDDGDEHTQRGIEKDLKAFINNSFLWIHSAVTYMSLLRDDYERDKNPDSSWNCIFYVISLPEHASLFVLFHKKKPDGISLLLKECCCLKCCLSADTVQLHLSNDILHHEF